MLRHSPRTLSPRTATIEHLEGRRLLSHAPAAPTAVLDASGVLEVNGTRKADLISIHVDAADATKLDVTMNGTTVSFALADVKGIHVDAGSGNDTVTVDASVNVAATLMGGNGNDSMTGGSGNDDLDGGNGKDSLSGGAGDDTVTGDNGNDNEDGGAGNDTMSGGNGNDTLAGGDGDDSLTGGNGSDDMDGQAGTDTCSGGKGHDKFHSDDTAAEITDDSKGDVEVNGSMGSDTGDHHDSNGGDTSVLVSSVQVTSGTFAA